MTRVQFMVLAVAMILIGVYGLMATHHGFEQQKIEMGLKFR